MRWAEAGHEGEPLPLFQRFGNVSLFNMLTFGESCKGNDPQVGSAQFLCIFLCNTRFFQIRGRVSVARQLTSVMLSKSWTLLMNLTPPVTVILLCCGRMSYSYSIWLLFFLNPHFPFSRDSSCNTYLTLYFLSSVLRS